MPATSHIPRLHSQHVRTTVKVHNVTRLASAEQHRPRREADRIGHQYDKLLRHAPAHVAHRQPEAVPEEPEEQRVDFLQVVSEPNLRWSNACLNFRHFDSQSTGYLGMATTTVYPRLFEISITLTFKAGYLKRES